NLGDVVTEMEFKFNSEFLCQRTEPIGNLFAWNLETITKEFETRQKYASFDIGILVRLQDVAAIAKNEAGDSRHQALLVGTCGQECGSFRHGLREWRKRGGTDP